ncbi:uncharacterized protein LOC123922668 [Trifolium pratense]|nr:uncharacterized protein LOC123922668 [Trifolium pratense]
MVIQHVAFEKSQWVTVIPDTRANSMKPIEKKKSLASTSNSCKVYDKPKGLHQEGSTSSKIYKCEFCNKIFGCGKALGGHKRFHLQLLRKENEAKARVSFNSSNYDGKQICHVCKKNFSSNKALYGHMRSHPEREWRGIHPNKFNYNIDYDYDDDDDNHDQDQYFIGAPKKLVIDDDESITWPPRFIKTNKRGRSYEVDNAAQILMHMSRAKILEEKLNENLDYEEKVLPSTTSGTLVDDNIDETKLKKRKMLVKLKNPFLASKEKNLNRYQCEIGESSQSKSRIVRAFDLNE